MTAPVQTSAPAGMPDARAIALARKLGRHAGLNNAGILTCPYKAKGTPAQRVLMLNWVRSYRQWDPSSVSYEG